MSREKRIWYPGAAYHVMSRGIRRSAICKDQMEYVFENGDTKFPANWKFKGNPSLGLLKVEEAYVWVKTFEKKTVSLNFTYNGVRYNYMRISQSDMLDCYRNKADNSYPLGTIPVVFSLTDKYYWNGKYYKIVAQILY